MNCNSCGSQLPEGAKVCPTCGTPTPAFSSNAGTASPGPTEGAYPYNTPPGSPSPYEPTVVAPSQGSPSPYEPTVVAPPPGTPQAPSTAYGPNPNVPPFNPSGQQNPNTPVPESYIPPPPPPPGYLTPQAEPQPSYPPAFPPAGYAGQPGQKQPRRFPAGLVVLLIVLVVLLIAGGGLIYYTAVYQPNLKHAQATATAVSQLTGTAQAQATAAVENPYTHSGTLAFADPLSANDKGHNWDENINCAFIGGTYHAIAPDPHFSDYCTANTTDFNNFTYEVQMRIIKGDAGGVIFRVENTNPNQYYAFYIGQDGSYSLDVVNGTNTSSPVNGSSPAIKQGLNQNNLVSVVAQGNTITLYVNHQPIGSTTNSTYNHGQIGVYAVVYNQPTEVAFSNARVWTS